MPISDRVESTLENWQDKWKVRLKGWVSDVLAFGMEVLLDTVGKAMAPKIGPLIDRMEATGRVPSELKPLLDEMRSPTGEVAALLGQSAGGALVGGAIGKVLDALLLPLAYAMNYATKNVILDPSSLVAAGFRGALTSAQVHEYLEWHGLDGTQEGAVKEIAKALVDVGSLIRLRHREEITETEYYSRMQKFGFDQENAVKVFTASLFYPPPPDLVRWQAKEVFEPEMITRYGLDSEFTELMVENMAKAGVSREQALNYWRAHWEHPEWRTIVEMLRRTDFTEQDMEDWFRLVEIPPYWRRKLIDISWEVPTRVDVRRFWDLRTIDEARLREIYTHHGYHGKDLEDYVLWTKVYAALPDLLARWKNGWITIEQVRQELIALGMPRDRVEEIIQTKIKSAAPERTVTERDLTKTDIYRGVKTGVITRGQALELLVDLGYDEDEAEYILAINIPKGETEEEITARELTKGDIKAALKQELITPGEAQVRLVALRYTSADARFLVEIYQAAIAGMQPEPQRSLTKADIVKGVKKGIITHKEGYTMLQEIGYAPEDADFILTVSVEVEARSPISYEEFKAQTQLWRKATGIPVEELPEELKLAGEELVKLTGDVDALKRAEEEELRTLTLEAREAGLWTERLKEVRVSLHRAEAVKQATQLRYNALVAEYRHRGE